jgi:hypothetical protein
MKRTVIRAMNLVSTVVLLSGSASAERRSPPTTERIGCRQEIRAPFTPRSQKWQPPQSTLTANTIELLVAYTPRVLAKVGSLGELEAEIGRIVAYANAAHANSGTTISFSTVKIHALTTDATDNFTADLQSATFVDGVWDELLTLREEVGADAVTVLVDGSQRGTLCGLAWTNGVGSSFQDSYGYMYSIVSVSGTCTRDTFVHEIGHNLGSSHARVDNAGAGSQPYSYGYRFTGSSGQGWHTIMAIPGTDRLIPFFSTPLMSYDGAPMGVVDSEDNVRSMELAAPHVASLAVSKGLPNITASPPSEVTMVRVAYTKSRNRRRVKIVASPMLGSRKLPYQPLEIFYSQGRRGVFRLRAAGRSDRLGNFTLMENLVFPSGYFYRVCYPGYTSQQLCSKPVDLRRLK